MRLSTKARYATRALIELAHNYGQGPVRLKDIAKNQDISAKYLEQVLFSPEYYWDCSGPQRKRGRALSW